MPKDQQRRIVEVVDREESRLRNFIRRRVADPRDVEDIVQEVFSELVEANALLMPIDHITGWLFRVARNRIIDLFRRKKQTSERVSTTVRMGCSPSCCRRPTPDRTRYARRVLLGELEDAIDELPKEQRDVFIAHEIDGRSFKEISATTGVNVNTLLSRKRYAVMHLRRRLQGVYDDLTNG